MKRRTTELVAGFAIFALFATGCAGLSTVREELALREMAKRSYAQCNGHRRSGLYAKDFERGWRQGYYNVSRGADTCPPSVPPEVYWSTRYQNAQGCKSISAWYQGYNAGATEAVAECRPGFSKVPFMASCVREKATQCAPVQPLRHPAIDDLLLSDSLSDDAFPAMDSPQLLADSRETPRAETDSLSIEQTHTQQQQPPLEFSAPASVLKADAGEVTLDENQSAKALDVKEPEVASPIIRASFPGPVRLPAVD